MTGEFSNNETQEIKPFGSENFREIKPNTPMTDQDVEDYWKSEFQNVASYQDDNKGEKSSIEVDDNGAKFRDGEKLLPNKEYEVNGYNYETDDKGRIVSADGKLRMRNPGYTRNMEKVRNYEGQEYKAEDQKGHLIGHQFGGSDKLDNIVPMAGELNQGDFKKMENTLADAVKNGSDVRYKVEPVYEGNSTRPSEFRVTYSIDGDKEVTVFKNGNEAQHG